MRLPTAQPAACNWSRGAAAHTLVTESAQSLPAGGCRKGEWTRDGIEPAMKALQALRFSFRVSRLEIM